MNYSGQEKRIYPRKQLRTRVIFEDETGEGFVYFYTTDISMGGLFFESDVPLKLGTKVFLSFSLHEGDPLIRATGQVVRVEKESGGASQILGMGIQYLDLPEAGRQAIVQYIQA
ncbi:MAG: PilZ domain-containing protein [Deltaproteobacteria bacterium]|nr:PilZ domain-containing protein [Deltaproteobacteria bacterium]